jgi:alginate lyase
VLGGTLLSTLAKPKLLFPGARDARRPAIDVAAIDRARILRAARRYLREAPLTITSFPAARSAGGKHDYSSEGDYWWPDPANPSGPYIQRDGLTNPGNFTDHRLALIRLSVQMPALSAAWLITKEESYAAHAAAHLRAWFVDETTRMNPNLEFAQAIHGRTAGRGIGIIDTVHLVEVARAAAALEGSKSFASDVGDKVKRWFSEYLSWITTSPHGIEEREARNNHGTCWVLQVTEFARYTENAELVRFSRKRFTSVLVPNQIAPNGSFPLELRARSPTRIRCSISTHLPPPATFFPSDKTPSGNLDCQMGAACERHWNTCFPTLQTRRAGPCRLMCSISITGRCVSPACSLRVSVFLGWTI